MKNILKSTFLTTAITIAALSTSFAEEIKFYLSDWKPFMAQDLPNGGPMTEYVAEIFKKSGHTHSVDFTSWQRAFEKVKDGSYHISFPWVDTAERRKDFHYSKKPLLTETISFYYNPEKFTLPEKLTYDALKGIRVGYPRGFSEEAALKKAGANLKLIGNYTQSLKMLQAGRIAATLGETGPMEKLVKELNLDTSKVVKVEAPIKVNNSHVIFSKKIPGIEKIVAEFDAAHETMPDYK